MNSLLSLFNAKIEVLQKSRERAEKKNRKFADFYECIFARMLMFWCGM
jgi:hypothetical protein